MAAVLAGGTLEGVARANGLSRQRVSQIMREKCPGWNGAARRAAATAVARAEQTVGERSAALARRLQVKSVGRPRLWSDESILAVIAASAVDGCALSVAQWRSQGMRPSVTVVVERFGSWNAACAAAGVAFHEPPTMGASKMPDRDMIAAVARFLSDPTARDRGGIRSYGKWARDAGAPSASLLRSRFGSWSEVKAMAIALLAEQAERPIRTVAPRPKPSVGARPRPW